MNDSKYYCDKFYEVWRDDKKLGQFANLDYVALQKGDILLEYSLNNVLKVKGFSLSEEEW